MGPALTKAALKSPLSRRVLSALVLIPLAAGIVYVGGWALIILVVAASALMLHEWLTISQKTAAPVDVALLTLAVSAAVVAAYLRPFPWVFAAIAAAMALAGIASAVRRRGPLWPMLGALYVGVPAAAIIWLREHASEGFAYTLGLMVAVWATDIGAYFAGRALGGPKLAPRISPAKTWAGLLGGMVAAALAMTALGLLFDGGFIPWLLLAGALTAVLAQAGDLAESALKRRFHVKDSGAIIPGHGGILDRVDGLIFVFPAFVLAYFYF